jgi:hypothetical protein
VGELSTIKGEELILYKKRRVEEKIFSTKRNRESLLLLLPSPSREREEGGGGGGRGAVVNLDHKR